MCNLWYLSIIGVGKSWLLLRWSGETAKITKTGASMPTIGIDFKMKSIPIDGKRVKVQVVSSSLRLSPFFSFYSLSI
jgi:hypothetical protein